MKRGTLAAIVGVLVFGASSCWTTPKPPTEGSAFPGSTWITPAQPWHATEPPGAMLVESEQTVLLAGAYGWIARLDLATGLIVAEKRIGQLAIDDLVMVPPGRALAVGTRHDEEGSRTEAMIVDLATLAARQITLGSKSIDESFTTAGAALLPDGTVAISGPGLPLATYDPKTWEIAKVLDEEMSWSGVRASDTAVIAYRSASVYRFDLKTGDKRSIGIGTHVSASKDIVAMRRYDHGKWYVETATAAGNTRTIATAIEQFALDRDGKWLVAASKQGVILVHSLPDGKLWKKYDLGAAGRGVTNIQIAGDTLVLATSSLVRRIDLRTGNTSPAGIPPYGTTSHLAVADDGSVLAIGSEAWRIVGAAVVATAPLDGGTIMYSLAGETLHVGTIDDSDPKRNLVTLRAFDTKTVRRWTLDQDTLNGWVSTRGEVAIELLFGDDAPGKLVRSDGARMLTLTALHTDANVRDVDLDASLALVEMKGEVHVVKLGQTSVESRQRLRAPACKEYSDALLEHGGERALTLDGGDAIAWDRVSGKALGSVHLDETPTHTMFVSSRDDVLFVIGNGVVLWSPRSGELRTYADVAIYDAAVSPNAKRLALGLGDGRVVLADFEAIRAKMRVTRAHPTKIPAHCNELDPFDAGTEDPSYDDPDDPCSGGSVDPCAP